MEIKILEYDEEKELVFEILGEGHTFANIIREFLCDTRDVDSAGYYKEHPFIEKAKLIVKAAPKRKLDKAVRAACRDLSKAADDFYKLLEKSV
jgi:DNA-directed RNA polymerase subunit L